MGFCAVVRNVSEREALNFVPCCLIKNVGDVLFAHGSIVAGESAVLHPLVTGACPIGVCAQGIRSRNARPIDG